MKNITFSVGLFLIFCCAPLQGGISFITSFEKAKSLALEENKLIFVDVMADWCLPCKAMIRDINDNAMLYNYLNDNFINLQINEKTNKSFLAKYNVSGFPTLLFLNNQGEVVQSQLGYYGSAHLFEIVKTHANKGKFYNIKDLSYYKNLEKGPLLKELEETIFNLPKDMAAKRAEIWLNSGGMLSTLTLENFTQYLDYNTFSNYLKKNPSKSTRMGENLIMSYLSTASFKSSNKEALLECVTISKLTGLDSKKAQSFMLAYKEFLILDIIGMAKPDNKIIYAKSLLKNYPVANEKNLLYLCMVEVGLREKNSIFFEEVKPTFEDLAFQDPHFIYCDFLSVIYFKEGRKDEASKMINEAMIKSKDYVDRFQPILAKYKKQMAE